MKNRKMMKKNGTKAMIKSKEYQISVVLFCVSLVLYAISMITGLIPELTFSIDKICMYLGFAFMGAGLVYLRKTKDMNDKEEK